MSTLTNLPPALQASLNQARTDIPLAHHKVPKEVLSSLDSAFIYINDWAFLNSHIYVKNSELRIHAKSIRKTGRW
jgi:hypothetical protein